MATVGQVSELPVVRRIDGEYGIWRAGGHPLTVEYRLGVLEEIRAAVGDAFRAVRRGGLEIGGVLFGRREGHLVQITAQRPIECEHASGPAFVLSPRDEAALEGLLQHAAADPALAGQQPVGWYHSHTRTEISLSAKDREIYDRYFPERWQLALVLKPQPDGPTRAAFFSRESEREEDFVVVPYRSQHPRPAPLPEPVPARIPAKAAAPPALPLPRIRPAQELRLEVLPAARPRKWPWFAGGLAVVLVAAAILFYRFVPLPSDAPVASPALGLRAIDTDGQLLISWDRAARPALEAGSAVLEIKDGGHLTTVPLDREHLRKGTVTYQRHSGQVELHMKVFVDGGSVEEIASFVGEPIEPPSPAAAPAPDGERAQAIQERDQALQEADALRAALRNQVMRNNQLSDAVRALRERLAVESSLQQRR